MNKIKLNRKTIKGDGACLFYCVRYALEGNFDNTDELRIIVSETIIKESVEYIPMLNGWEHEKYAKWILKPDSWGGEPEMKILSKHLKTRIVVGEVESGEIFSFGEEYTNCLIIILCSGHFDLAGDFIPEEECEENKYQPGQFLFDYSEDLKSSIKDLLTDLKDKFCKGMEIENYSINCLDCGGYFIDFTDYQIHSNKYSHTNYKELDKNKKG
jgi:ubiquitin thioesterase OTU1